MLSLFVQTFLEVVSEQAWVVWDFFLKTKSSAYLGLKHFYYYSHLKYGL